MSNEMHGYFSFICENGIALSNINPGSDELALKIEDGLTAIDLLRHEKIPILGGDILAIKNGVLTYTYENWYCNEKSTEKRIDYLNRSYDVAVEYIVNIMKKNEIQKYVVFVT